ncbi:MAG: hypothetical protein ABIS01_10065 [Ferruginibacter sp.]
MGAGGKVSHKKTDISKIIPLICAALSTLKEKLGEKKFEKRVRKAARLMVDGINQAPTKKESTKKVNGKKPGKTSIIHTVAKKQP